jgi:hypothetical protein
MAGDSCRYSCVCRRPSASFRSMLPPKTAALAPSRRRYRDRRALLRRQSRNMMRFRDTRLRIHLSTQSRVWCVLLDVPQIMRNDDTAHGHWMSPAAGLWHRAGHGRAHATSVSAEWPTLPEFVNLLPLAHGECVRGIAVMASVGCGAGSARRGAASPPRAHGHGHLLRVLRWPPPPPAAVPERRRPCRCTVKVRTRGRRRLRARTHGRRRGDKGAEKFAGIFTERSEVLSLPTVAATSGRRREPLAAVASVDRAALDALLNVVARERAGRLRPFQDGGAPANFQLYSPIDARTHCFIYIHTRLSTFYY